VCRKEPEAEVHPSRSHDKVKN